ncbi:MAG TPA: hypothetical protein VKY85_07840 [Candidatus Angelobacter sp.]|nr:hypothetical protein [Candidatus Angelobacter sp.]
MTFTAAPAQPLYTDEGLRVLLAEDWFIYVVNEADGLVWIYNTELWPEWTDDAVPNFEEPPIIAMVPFAHRHQPQRLAKLSCNYCHARGPEDQQTLAEFEASLARKA